VGGRGRGEVRNRLPRLQAFVGRPASKRSPGVEDHLPPVPGLVSQEGGVEEGRPRRVVRGWVGFGMRECAGCAGLQHTRPQRPRVCTHCRPPLMPGLHGRCRLLVAGNRQVRAGHVTPAAHRCGLCEGAVTMPQLPLARADLGVSVCKLLVAHGMNESRPDRCGLRQRQQQAVTAADPREFCRAAAGCSLLEPQKQPNFPPGRRDSAAGCGCDARWCLFADDLCSCRAGRQRSRLHSAEVTTARGAGTGPWRTLGRRS